MDTHRLLQILSESTYQLRKGAEVVEHKEGNVDVTELYSLPHESDINAGVKVDCHFRNTKTKFCKFSMIGLPRLGVSQLPNLKTDLLTSTLGVFSEIREPLSSYLLLVGFSVFGRSLHLPQWALSEAMPMN